MLLTGGFAELDDTGKAAQDEFVPSGESEGDSCHRSQHARLLIVLLQCLMVYYRVISRRGSIGLVGQSGNLTRSLAFPGVKRGLGIPLHHRLRKSGGRSVSRDHPVPPREDDAVNAIGLHIEGINDGRTFFDEVAETTKVKPVVVMKTGRTEQGARIISSHTASLAGQDEVYEAAFKQCGALRVESAVEFSSLLLALSHGKLPKGEQRRYPVRGRRRLRL